MRRLLLWVFFAAVLHGGFFLLPVIKPFSQAEVSESPQSRTTLIHIEAKRGGQDVAQPLTTDMSISANKAPLTPIATVTPETDFSPKPVPKVAQKPLVQKALSVKQVVVEQHIPPEVSTVEVQLATIPSKVAKSSPTPQSVARSKIPTEHSDGKAINHSDKTVSKKTRLMAKAVSTRKPKYPRRAIVRNQQGSVSVELLITEEGTVERAELLESSGFELLDRSVMKFVDKERFIAALEQGQPIASTQLFTFRFVLN